MKPYKSTKNKASLKEQARQLRRRAKIFKMQVAGESNSDSGLHPIKRKRERSMFHHQCYVV